MALEFVYWMNSAQPARFPACRWTSQSDEGMEAGRAHPTKPSVYATPSSGADPEFRHIREHLESLTQQLVQCVNGRTPVHQTLRDNFSPSICTNVDEFQATSREGLIDQWQSLQDESSRARVNVVSVVAYVELSEEQARQMESGYDHVGLHDVLGYHEGEQGNARVPLPPPQKAEVWLDLEHTGDTCYEFRTERIYVLSWKFSPAKKRWICSHIKGLIAAKIF